MDLREHIGAFITALPFLAVMIGVAITVQDPNLLGALTSFSPWAATHAQTLGYGAIAIVTLACVALLGKTLYGAMTDGSGTLEGRGDMTIGLAGSLGKILFPAIAVVAVAFLTAVGWFGAKNLFGW